MDTEKFKNCIRRVITLDEDIKRLSATLKQMRMEKDELNTVIQNFMQQNSIDTLDAGQCVWRLVRTTKSQITKKLYLERVDDFVKTKLPPDIKKVLDDYVYDIQAMPPIESISLRKIKK